MNLPNKLTIFRVLLIPLFVVILLCNILGDYSKITSLVIFVIACLTDFFDGYLARKYNLITNFGKFMDPLADKLLVCVALICLQEIGLLKAWIVIVIMCREFIISGFRLVASDAGVVIAAGIWGKLKTNAQMFMIIFLLLDLKGTLSYIGIGLTYIAVVLTVISLVDYIYQNKNVFKTN